ncbi:MAG TPA: HAMP domain-containing protein, partial [Bacillota bacterium]|nr:HAMP domain-containing protein [Bacillota bacterium]
MEKSDSITRSLFFKFMLFLVGISLIPFILSKFLLNLLLTLVHDQTLAFFIGILLLSIVSITAGYFFFRGLFIRPIRSLTEATEKMAQGNFDIPVEITTNDEFGFLSRLLHSIAVNVREPLQMASTCIEKIGKGEIPGKITKEYPGDFNKLIHSLNACIEELGVLEECKAVLQRIVVIDCTKKMEGRYSGVFQEIAVAINEIITELVSLNGIIKRIGDGVLPERQYLGNIKRHSENDEITPSIVKMIDNIMGLVEESLRLSQAAVAGKLDARGDASRFKGEYRRVIEGFNQTLDAVVTPIQIGAVCIEKIGKGEIPEKITKEYPGDFNKFVNSINASIEGLGVLKECKAVLQRLMVADYTQKMEGKYVGVFQEIAVAINETIAKLVGLNGTIKHIG